MLRRLGHAPARFVGLTMTLLGTWAVVINVIEDSYSGGTLVWILASGALGAVGGLLYLVSFDGPDRFRTRWTRYSGWLGMLVLALLPWSFAFLVLPMVLLTVPTLIAMPDKGRVEVTRDGRIFTIVRNGNEIRVLTNIGNDIRVEVVSDSVDSEMLLGLAEEISRDTSRNQ